MRANTLDNIINLADDQVQLQLEERIKGDVSLSYYHTDI